MTRMQKQRLRILIKLLVLAPLLAGPHWLDAHLCLPGSELCPGAMGGHFFKQLPWLVAVVVGGAAGTEQLPPLPTLASSGDRQREPLLASPELGLHLERVLCRPAPVQPRRSWTWAVGGREEGRPPPRLAAHKPFHPPSGSRLPFPPAQPCCNCIPGIALRGPPLPLGPSCGGGWETHTAGTRCFGQTYPRLT